MSKYASGIWTENGVELMSWELENMFKEWIDECYEPVEIVGIEFCPGDVLESCDPTAFRCYLNDWIDMEVQEGSLFDHDPTEDEE